jgi:gamma-glutamyltranspeptidase/glutathione hydrolase
LELDDLKHHLETGSQEVDAISLKFNGQNIAEGGKDAGKEGVEVWEHPPNGQGIVALMVLGIIEELERAGKIPKFTREQHNSAVYLHAVIESLRIAFADATWWVTDPDVEKVPSQDLLSRKYLAERAKLFSPDKVAELYDHGSPAHNHCDTVYFAVTDKDGNGMSFINSNFGGFGTCIVPKGCGFTLQNRGANFNLTEGHPNALAPRKRSYHTIIPAMITNPSDGSLHTVYGVMGGFMQPQGHVQVLLNMLAFKYNPQVALDAPRFCIGAGMPGEGKVLDRTIFLEEGMSEEAIQGLKDLGHNINVLKGFKRGMFGRGQVIRCHYEGGKVVYSAGSDMRGDGCAFPG